MTDHVTSPTFTIVNEYHDGRLPFYHFDVYRLSCEEEMDDIGYEDQYLMPIPYQEINKCPHIVQNPYYN